MATLLASIAAMPARAAEIHILSAAAMQTVLVVPMGTAKPPLRAVDDFRNALLGAKVVVYADPAGGGAAGIHIAKLIGKLGIADELRPKTKYGAGGDVFDVTLAQGEGRLGLTQISEIVGKPGGEFVGALPDELQNYTGITVGTLSGAASAAPVVAFIEFLKGPAAGAAIRARGMQPSTL